MGVGDKGRDNPGEANPRGRGTMTVASLRAGNYIKSHLTFSCPLIARYYSFTARFYCPATIVLIGLFRSLTGGCAVVGRKRNAVRDIESDPRPLVSLRNCRGTRFRHAGFGFVHLDIASRRLGNKGREEGDLRGYLTRSRANDEIIVRERIEYERRN